MKTYIYFDVHEFDKSAPDGQGCSLLVEPPVWVRPDQEWVYYTPTSKPRAVTIWHMANGEQLIIWEDQYEVRKLLTSVAVELHQDGSRELGSGSAAAA